MAEIGFKASAVGLAAGGAGVMMAVRCGTWGVFHLKDWTVDIGLTTFTTDNPVTIPDHKVLRGLDGTFVEFSLIGSADVGWAFRQRMVLKIKGDTGSGYIYEHECTVEGSGVVMGDVVLTGYPKRIKATNRADPFTAHAWANALLARKTGTLKGLRNR